MPTYEPLPHFLRDFRRLTDEEEAAWERALALFVQGLRTRRFAPILRIKRVQGYQGVWEMTWAPDGRATFHYGTEVRLGTPHIVWRRIGTHEIFREP